MADSENNNEQLQQRDPNEVLKTQFMFRELLSPGDAMIDSLLSGYMGMGSMLGGGTIAIPDDPTIVWPQLFWNHPFAQYVYFDMEEKDDRVAANLDSRKENLLSKSWHVEPAGDKLRDKKIAEFVEQTLRDYMEFDEMLREMMDAIGDGVTTGEIEWANGRDRVYPAKVHFRQQQLFSFSAQPFGNFAAYGGAQTGELRLRPGLEIVLQELNLDPAKSLEAQMPYKWQVNSFRPKWGNRWGSPIKRRCFWWTWFKKGGLRAWLKMLEKGPGTILVPYSRGGNKDEQQIALKAGQAIMEESQVAMPEHMIEKAKLLEHVRGNMGSLPKDLVDDICNNAITVEILGQTLTSRGSEGGGGNRALGQVHEKVPQRKLEVDAKGAMRTLNARGGIVEAITFFQFGPQDAYPKVKIHYEPGADKKLASDTIDRGLSWGLSVSKKQVREDLELREPDDVEDTLQLPPKPQGQAGEVDTVGESAAFAEETRELIDLLKDVKKKSRQRFSAMRLRQPT